MVLLRAAKEKVIKGNQSMYHREEVGNAGIPCGSDNAGKKDTAYYAAVDIGTTTLSIEVYDQYGGFVGGNAEDNAQGNLGSDVMMRLMHVSEGRGETIYQLIREQIHRNILQILRKQTTVTGNVHTAKDVGLGALKKMTVVGNTVMCHLFLGKDTEGLRGSPFRTSYQGSYRITGRELGWQDCPETNIIVLPGIAAHVGADAAAVIAAEQLDRTDRVQLAVDLGTNAEIILNHHGEVYVCSAAAGPAFEGRGISCGCRGGAGALNGIQWIRANGNLLLDVVPEPTTGELIPRGLCGSGLIDAVAGLLANGLLQEDGYLLSSEEAKEQGICDAFAARLQENAQGERCFLLLDPTVDKIAGHGREPSRTIYITQTDIRNFQLAKSAIQTGIVLLSKSAGLQTGSIEECLVAGVFGAFLHPENAISCGLLPSFPADKINFVGNAAGRGAAFALFDTAWISRLEKRLENVHHVELAQQADFQSEFMANIALHAWRS